MIVRKCLTEGVVTKNEEAVGSIPTGGMIIYISPLWLQDKMSVKFRDSKILLNSDERS